MLALAEELQNISVACKRAGISRSHYYDQAGFREVRVRGPGTGRPAPPAHAQPDAARAGGTHSRNDHQYPTYSYVRISGQLKLIGVSPAAIESLLSFGDGAVLHQEG